MESSGENSGSLTGHILAQGWADAPAQDDHGTTKVVLVLVVGLGVVVAISVLVAFAIGSVFSDIFGGLLGD